MTTATLDLSPAVITGEGGFRRDTPAWHLRGTSQQFINSAIANTLEELRAILALFQGQALADDKRLDLAVKCYRLCAGLRELHIVPEEDLRLKLEAYTKSGGVDSVLVQDLFMAWKA